MYSKLEISGQHHDPIEIISEAIDGANRFENVFICARKETLGTLEQIPLTNSKIRFRTLPVLPCNYTNMFRGYSNTLYIVVLDDLKGVDSIIKTAKGAGNDVKIFTR